MPIKLYVKTHIILTIRKKPQKSKLRSIKQKLSVKQMLSTHTHQFTRIEFNKLHRNLHTTWLPYRHVGSRPGE